jgi:signal transduction histidine kinase
MRAGTLGRRAMSGGLGVLEMVVMHHASLGRALAAAEAAGPRGLKWPPILEAASLFLCEALSSFEITHKGFREATEVTRRVLWLASVVSHELKTPLTGVINSAGMLQEVLGAGTRSVEARLLENVLASAHILRARTDELADLVGLHSGSLALKFDTVDVAALVRAVAQRMEAEAGAAGLDLAVSVDENVQSILADERRLDQILSNLIQNAIKYGSDGRRVDVRCHADAGRIVLEVQDYGAGISLWDRMSLFQPYFRGERGSKEVPGVGLGLALCRELVQMHHGNISVETEEGRGSLFRVELPVATPAARRTGP